MRIYTKTGDSGETGLFGGRRVRKDDPRIEACGSVDELNAVIGLAAVACEDDDESVLLESIQSRLFSLGADLATPTGSGEIHGRVMIERVGPEAAAALESEIDRFEEELPPLTRFILPGGSALAAHLHHARAVCRRAERSCVELAAGEQINPEIIRFLNRLSDLLFVMARIANHRAGLADVIWEVGA